MLAVSFLRAVCCHRLNLLSGVRVLNLFLLKTALSRLYWGPTGQPAWRAIIPKVSPLQTKAIAWTNRIGVHPNSVY